MATVSPPKEKLVIHVEDDDLSALLVDRVLRLRDYKIVRRRTGLEGIAVAEDLHPDLILVDINLPDLNGYLVTNRLRQMSHLQHIPIVALTARRGEEARRLALEAGCNDLISKPVDIKKLPHQLDRFLTASPAEPSPTEQSPAYFQAYQTQLVDKQEQYIQELLAANQALMSLTRQQSSLLEALSFQLRTWQTPLRGYADLLQQEKLGRLNYEQDEALQIMRRALTHQERLLADLLDLSQLKTKHQSLRRQSLNLADLLTATAALLDPAQIDLHLQTQPLTIYADPDRLQQALMLLLTHISALSPEPPAPRLELHLSHPAETPTLRLQISRWPGQTLHFQALQRLLIEGWDHNLPPQLSPNTQVKLLIVQTLLQAHGGQLHLSPPTETRLASVTLTLPQNTHSPGEIPAG